MSRYRLELPRRSIAVDNAIVLEPVGRLELTRENPSRRVVVRSRGTIRGELPVSLALTQPKTSRGTSAPWPIVVRQVGPGAANGQLRLTDGSGTFELSLLNPERVPPGLEVFQDGRIDLTAGPGTVMEPMAIAVGLRIGLAELESIPATCRLEARNGGDRSGPIRVAKAGLGAGGLPLVAKTLQVALGAPGGKLRFGPRELWLEPENGPSPDPARRSQTLAVPPGQSFRIAFAPSVDPAKRGRHALTWTVTAPAEAIPMVGALTIDYETPRLVGPAEPIQLVAGPGERGRSVAIPVRLEGLVGEACRVVFRPDRSSRGLAVFTRKDAGAKQGDAETTALALGIQGPEQAVAVVAAAREAPGIAEVHLDLNIADDLPFGVYETRGVNMAGVGGEVLEAAASIEVTINALEVLVASEERTEGWMPTGRVALGQFIGGDVEKTVRVRTGMRGILARDDFKIRFLIDFRRTTMATPTADPRAAPGLRDPCRRGRDRAGDDDPVPRRQERRPIQALPPQGRLRMPRPGRSARAASGGPHGRVHGDVPHRPTPPPWSVEMRTIRPTRRPSPIRHGSGLICRGTPALWPGPAGSRPGVGGRSRVGRPW